MPLVNCIHCFVDRALHLSLCYLLLKFVVYLSTMPRWVEPMPSLICVNPRVFQGSYSSGNSPSRSSHSNHFNRVVNERLCIEEVGVDLEPCVHAHGHDVDLIIKASLTLIIPLV